MWIPVAAGVAVLAVVAGLVLATGGDDAAPAQSPPPRDRTVAADPPVLRLGQGPESPTAGRTTADAPANLRLATAPPTGPARGPVRAYPLDEAAPSADVARLAAALGVPGRPLREGAGWTVRGATATLRVEDVSGWPWLLAPDDQPPPLLDSTAARRPGDLAARDAAEGVLRRVDAGGYGPARPVAGEAGYADVIASPLVATLPTAGLETWLRFDDRLRLAAASGWLGRPETAATYPLLQARAALEASHGTAQCPPTCGEAVSAVAGLALRRQADGRALLVPAWLFETRGGAVPLTALAIPPAYLDAPEPQPTATGSMPIPLPTR